MTSTTHPDRLVAANDGHVVKSKFILVDVFPETWVRTTVTARESGTRNNRR